MSDYKNFNESEELIINKITKNGSLNYQFDSIIDLIIKSVLNGRFNYDGGGEELKEILEEIQELSYRNGQLSTYPD